MFRILTAIGALPVGSRHKQAAAKAHEGTGAGVSDTAGSQDGSQG